jgi:uncharacterized protein
MIEIVLLIVLGVAAAVDFFFIEPYRIQVTHYDIQGRVSAPLKIAHVSDLHTHGLGRRERRMLEILAAEKPDIIVIMGDTLGNRRGNNYEMSSEVYDRLHAPLCVWFVRGNWENERPFGRGRAFYYEGGLHFLLNANEAARPDVWIIGLDTPYTGTAKLDTALVGVPSGAYKIALFHSPAYFDRIAGRVNLCLAGHTHGGQARLPFVNPSDGCLKARAGS